MQAQISSRTRADKGGTFDANDLDFGELERGERGFRGREEERNAKVL